MTWVQPATLEGQTVRLEPLAAEHEEELWQVGQDPRIWEFMFIDVRTRADFHTVLGLALDAAAAGTRVPFVIVERASNRLIGSTSYFNFMPQDRNLEIGHTWLGSDYWRTAANTECKYLLLRHAFETLNCARVQFKTDALNLRSRAAIKRLGALEEGILRKHIWVQSRRFRDSVIFSIVDDEWPTVRERLEAALQPRPPAPG